MKLKEVTRTAKRRGQSGLPNVTVSRKGTIYFNNLAMQYLGATNGVKVKFLVDEEDAQSWFVTPSDDGYATLKPKKIKDPAGQIHLSDIAEKIIQSFYHIGDTSLKFTLASPVYFNNAQVFKLQLIKESLVMDIPNPNGPIKL